MAFPALACAQEEDPLRAEAEALWAAVVSFGPVSCHLLFQRVREVFLGRAGPKR